MKLIRSKLIQTFMIIGVFCLILFYISYLPDPESYGGQENSVLKQLKKLEEAVDLHNEWELRLKRALLPPQRPSDLVLPILVIACQRPTVQRTLDALIKHRSNVLHLSAAQFPIVVSQGCESQPTASVLASYGSSISVINYRFTTKEPPVRILNTVQKAYQAMTHHYKHALDYMFLTKNYSAVVVVEDDLDIAPDFFEYFAATFPLLSNDPTLFCVSAWNDNGRPQLIDERRTNVVYRTDFFPGLGWMLLRGFWLEIRDKWPDIYWDEYVRQPYVRRDRSCIRPEIGRTTTFGRSGTSRGQYFDTYLKPMRLNVHKVDFLTKNLSFLLQPEYGKQWHRTVYEQSRPISREDLLNDRLPEAGDTSLIVTYTSEPEFVRIAKHLGLMPDFKSGVARTAFQGVVPVFWKNRQLYIAPPRDWKGYLGS